MQARRYSKDTAQSIDPPKVMRKGVLLSGFAINPYTTPPNKAISPTNTPMRGIRNSVSVIGAIVVFFTLVLPLSSSRRKFSGL